ncbi:MAG: ABC transporter substrate-binding protein [Clostridia bacterium]
MKIRKFLSMLLLIAIFATLIAGCSPKSEKESVNILALKGPTGIGLAWLMDGNGNENYNITLVSSPDEITGKFANGVDIAAMPINLASVLYNKMEGDAIIIAVNTLGVLYVLENGNTVNSITDLTGKTLYATGQASTPEYILNHILEKNNIDCTVEYKTEHSELATLIGSGDIVLGMLPEPNVTSVLNTNKDVRIALNLTSEWNKIEDTELVQACIVINKKYLTEHTDVVDIFLKDYAESVNQVNNNTSEIAPLIEKYGIMASAALAEKAVKNCNIVCITGDSMKLATANMLTVLFNANPKSIGGKLPSDDFYYIGQK